MSQKTRSDKNSVTSAVQGFQGALKTIEPPESVKLTTDEEHILWGQFTRARAPEDWRDVDLVLIAKIVQMEVELRNYKEQLLKSGAIIENKRGTNVVNPLVSLIDTIERRQLSVIRSLGLNQQHSDPRTLNARASQLKENRDTLQNLDEDLIASPK